MRNLIAVIAVTFALLVGANATAQTIKTLTFEKAKVNFDKATLDYQASIDGFSITDPGDYLIVVTLTNTDNWESNNTLITLTEFNDEHVEGGGNFGDCPGFVDIRVKKASLNIDENEESDDDDANTLRIKAKLCNYSCVPIITNFEATLVLFNFSNGEFAVDNIRPITHLLPKRCI